MSWLSNEPEKTTRTGATGADVTKANFTHLKLMFTKIACYWDSVTGHYATGWDETNTTAEAQLTEVVGTCYDIITAADTPYTATHKQRLLVDTSVSAVTIKLPATPDAGDWVEIIDYSGTFNTNNCTADRNGNKINTAASNLTLSDGGQQLLCVYCDSTTGWRTFTNHNASYDDTLKDYTFTALGDTIYGSAAATVAKLAGNTTTTRKFLRQTGDGANSAAPAWDTVTKTDVGLGNVTDDAQVKASEKAAASGVATLNGSSKVVQDPANATATATASKIPIADGSGKLDMWVSDASTAVKGKLKTATNANTLTGTETDTAVTPDDLKYALANGMAIGGTTAGTCKHTTSEFTGLMTLTGGQIKFPASQSTSSDANTLDDYEEGTWTAAFACGTSGTITLNTGDDRTGTYTKTGRQVSIQGQFIVSSVDAPVGDLSITGLPFAASKIASVALYCYSLVAGAGISMNAYMATNSTIYVRGFNNGSYLVAAGYIQAGSIIDINCTFNV